MPKIPGSEPTRRSKRVVVIARPYCSPDPAGPKYEQYCRQSLTQHKSFRVVDLHTGYTTFTDAYAAFQSESVPPSLEDGIHRLQQHSHPNSEEQDTTEVTTCMMCIHACVFFDILMYILSPQCVPL